MTRAFFILLISLSTGFVLIADAQSKVDSILNLYKYNEQGRVSFEKVWEPNLSKKEIFKNAKKWIAINYIDYTRVVKLEDEPNGLIIYKGISTLPSGIGYRYEFTVQIDIKDNKFRIKLYDIGNLTYSKRGSVPIEETILSQKARKDKDKEYALKYLNLEYNQFPDLIGEMSIALSRNDDF